MRTAWSLRRNNRAQPTESTRSVTQALNQSLHQIAESLGQDYLPDGWQRVASSTYSRVHHCPARRLYCKQFMPRSPAEQLKAAVRGSRATRARINADTLRLHGFDAPATVHWGQLPNGSEYLFMDELPGHTVRQWLIDTAIGVKGNSRLRLALLRELGTFIGRLHATGFIHGDLRHGNVLAHWQGERFQFALLDNERNQLRSPPPGRMLLRNLMQLNMLTLEQLSLSERRRFFHQWHRQMRHLSQAEADVLALEAYRWAMRRMR